MGLPKAWLWNGIAVRPRLETQRDTPILPALVHPSQLPLTILMTGRNVGNCWESPSSCTQMKNHSWQHGRRNDGSLSKGSRQSRTQFC